MNNEVKKSVLAACGRYIRELHGGDTDRIAALEARIVQLESNQVKFRGLYSHTDSYRRGDLVTHAGSLFFAVRDTSGLSPKHDDNTPKPADWPWQIAVRRGRDGRDNQTLGGNDER